MFNAAENNKNRIYLIILVIVLLLIAIGLIYYFFFYAREKAIVTPGVGTTDTTGILKIKKIDLKKLNTEIFSAEKFKKLKLFTDIKQEISSIKKGNLEPFFIEKK